MVAIREVPIMSIYSREDGKLYTRLSDEYHVAIRLEAEGEDVKVLGNGKAEKINNFDEPVELVLKTKKD